MSLFIGLISSVFGAVADENEAVVKLCLFVLLFALFSKGSARIFTESRFATSLLSFVIALISVRMMPILWIMPLGKVLWVLAVIVLPYLIVDAIMHEWNLLKVLMLVLAYFGIYLLIATLGFWGFGLVFEAMADTKRLMFLYQWQSVVVGALLVLYVIALLVKKKNIESGWQKL
ncbi:MAG: hypothetical protein PHO02_01520 [Candidatus Nanoarchaeia archaeon]|nr:hypothetical protein [Candidatus Nanoarchaeia archaeon]